MTHERFYQREMRITLRQLAEVIKGIPCPSGCGGCFVYYDNPSKHTEKLVCSVCHEEIVEDDLRVIYTRIAKIEDEKMTPGIKRDIFS